MVVQFNEVKVVFLGEVRLVLSSVFSLRLSFVFSTFANTDLLRPRSYAVRRVANNCIKYRSMRNKAIFTHVEAKSTYVHSHEIWNRQFIILKVCVDVKLLYFV